VAKLIKRPDGQITAQSTGVYADITPLGDQPPRITYTAKDKSIGTCETLSFAPPAGATASAGRASHADLNQADGSMHFKGTKRDDLYYIEAGHARYEIVEAVVFGG